LSHNVSEKQGLSREAARKLIHKLDSKHSGFFRLAFAKDLDDPSLYDLVVSCEKLGYESAARLIIAAAQAEEIHACSLTALEAMEVSEMGVVELSGLTHSQELLDQIIEVVQKVPGVSEVNSEIVIGPPLYAGGLKCKLKVKYSDTISLSLKNIFRQHSMMTRISGVWLLRVSRRS